MNTSFFPGNPAWEQVRKSQVASVEKAESLSTEVLLEDGGFFAQLELVRRGEKSLRDFPQLRCGVIGLMSYETYKNWLIGKQKMLTYEDFKNWRDG